MKRSLVLDLLLQWGHYVVPHWYVGGFRYAYWDRFGRPENLPPYDPGIPEIWWYQGEPDDASDDSAGTLLKDSRAEETLSSGSESASEEIP